MNGEDYFYYDPAEFEVDPDENNYDYLEEIEEIEKNCALNDMKNKETIFESFEEDDIKYLSFIETIKYNILTEVYKDKPQYFRKSLTAQASMYKKISSISKPIIISPIELYYKMKYESFHKITHDEDRCTICLENLYEITKENSLEEVLKLNTDLECRYSVIMLDKCLDHFFHIGCVSDMIGQNEFIKCPVCMNIYGILTGTQPAGTMIAYLDKKTKCSGFEKYNTIVIQYNFPSGKGYTGTSRVAYLPDCPEGKKVLGLLKICFDRKLLFTVGTSVTTGQTNTTVWAGIHHKTNISGGSSHFGYPDPTYFTRVQEEMASKGVSADSLGDNPEVIADKLLSAGRKKSSLYF